MGSDQATINRIKQLKAIQPRSEFRTSTRDFLLSSIAPQLETETRVSFVDYSLFFTRMFKQQLFEPVVVMLLAPWGVPFTLLVLAVINALISLFLYWLHADKALRFATWAITSFFYQIGDLYSLLFGGVAIS